MQRVMIATLVLVSFSGLVVSCGGEQSTPGSLIAQPGYTPLSDGKADSWWCAPSYQSPGSPAPWLHPVSSLLSSSYGDPHHRGQDAIATPDQAAVISGKFAYGPLDKDLKRERVRVYLRASICDPYTLIGSAITSTDGQYGDQFSIHDDGGRAFFVLPPSQSPGVGRYELRMVVAGDLTMTEPFSLFVVPRGQKAVVFDIDGTLTQSDSELFKDLVDEIFASGHAYDPKQYPGADDVVATYAAKGYQLIFLSARPDVLTAMTRRWLYEHQFAAGVLHLNESEGDFVKGDSATVAYKARYLAYLQQVVGLEIVGAYGNATTDISAYEQAGIAKSRTYIIGKHAGKSSTQPLSDYRDHLSFVESLPDAN